MKLTIQRTSMADGSVAYDTYNADGVLDFFVDSGVLRIADGDSTIVIYNQGSWDRLTTDAAEKIQ